MIGYRCDSDTYHITLYRVLDKLMITNSILENLITKKFLTTKELKELLGISLATVYRLIDSRRIPVHKIGNSIRFSRNDIINYLKSNRIDKVK